VHGEFSDTTIITSEVKKAKIKNFYACLYIILQIEEVIAEDILVKRIKYIVLTQHFIKLYQS
jgi:hypothetical protein